MSLKTHFTVNDRIVCPIAKGRTSDNFRHVDCRNCQNTSQFAEAVQAYKDAVEADFAAQTPRTIVPQFGRVNEQGVMECPKCQGILWRERPRSLFSYHYVCEGCGNSVHPMTETGMST